MREQVMAGFPKERFKEVPRHLLHHRRLDHSQRVSREVI